MPKETLASDQIDTFAASYVIYIYQEYLDSNKDTLDEAVRDVLNNESKEENPNKVLLDWFFSHRHEIEDWYQNNNKSYQQLWENSIAQKIKEILDTKDLDNIYSFLGSQTTSLQQVLTSYDFIKEAKNFHLNIHAFGFKEATRITLQQTIDIIVNKILPIVSKTVDSYEEYEESEKEKIIKLFLCAIIDSISDVKSNVQSEEENVGIIFYTTQIQLFILPFIKKTSLDNFSNLEETIALATASQENLSQLVSNGIAYGQRLLISKSFYAIYQAVSVSEAESDDPHRIFYISYKIYQNLLKENALTTFLQLNEIKKIEKLIFSDEYTHAKAEYEDNIQYKLIEEKGRKRFKLMLNELEPTEITILKAYLALSLHKNKIKDKNNDILLRKLLDCCSGDIKNRLATEYPKITLSELKEIYEYNPEVRNYLLAFRKAFDSIPEGLSEDSKRIFIQQYSMLKNVIDNYEKLHCESADTFNDSEELSLQTESPISLTTDSEKLSPQTESPISIATDSEESFNLDELGTLSLESTENFDFQEDLLEENDLLPLLPEELVSNYDKYVMEVYCHYNLTEERDSSDPQSVGKINALLFFLEWRSSGVSLVEFIRVKKINEFSAEKLKQFWNGFFSEFTDPMYLGKYEEVISDTCKKDSTFLTFYLAFYLQQIDKVINQREKILTEDEQIKFYKTLLTETEQVLSRSFGSIPNRVSSFFGGSKDTKLKKLSDEVERIMKLPSQIKTLNTDIQDTFVRLSCLKNSLKLEIIKFNQKKGPEIAHKFLGNPSQGNLGETIQSLTFKSNLDEFLNSFIAIIQEKIDNKECKKAIKKLTDRDSTFAMLYLVLALKQNDLLHEIIGKDLTFKTPLLEQFISKLIKKIENILNNLNQKKNKCTNPEAYQKKYNNLFKTIQYIINTVNKFNDLSTQTRTKLHNIAKEVKSQITQQPITPMPHLQR